MENKPEEREEKPAEKPKIKKARVTIYRMNGKYKGTEKRRAYVPAASSLLKVVEKWHGPPQIYRNDQWEKLSMKELRNLVKAEEDVKRAAKCS